VPELFLTAFFVSNILPLIFLPSVEYDAASDFFLITAYVLLLYHTVVLIAGRYGERSVDAIMNGLCIGACLSAAIGIGALSGVLAHSDVFLRDGRVRALFKDPNVFGPFLSMAVIWLVSRLDSGVRHRYCTIGALILCSLGILLSYSRAAWISTILSVGAYYIVRIRIGGGVYLRRAPVLVVMVAVSSTAITWTAVHSSNVGQLLAMRAQIQSYDYDRFYVQELALAAASKSPIGRGPGQSEVYLPTVSHLGTKSTHSLFIRCLFENGWAGALALYVFLFSTAIASLRHAFSSVYGTPAAAAVFAALAGALLQGIVVDTLHWRHLWILCGLVWGMHAYSCKNLSDASNLRRGTTS
jgi:uncharacterized membrane protein